MNYTFSRWLAGSLRKQEVFALGEGGWDLPKPVNLLKPKTLAATKLRTQVLPSIYQHAEETMRSLTTTRKCLFWLIFGNTDKYHRISSN